MADALYERAAARRALVPTSDAALYERACQLAPAYVGDVVPTSVRYVTNQRTRWGSCSPETGAIRISDRLRGVPQYVLDVVLIHELCHLVVPDHSAAFRALAEQAPRRIEAEAFLAGLAFAAGAADEG